MFDFLLTKEQIRLRDEVRELVKWVPRQMVLDMDQDRLQFPKEFPAEAGRRNLLPMMIPERLGTAAMTIGAARPALQVMGGVGYTNVFPVERIVRDLQLASIWTGSNEIMSMIAAHEWYEEYQALETAGTCRDHEMHAGAAADIDEKVYE